MTDERKLDGPADESPVEQHSIATRSTSLTRMTL